MLNYNTLSRNPSTFRRFTGLEVNEFDALYNKVQENITAYEEKRLHKVDRKRKIGAGHPFKLSLRDRLLMLLMYPHLYFSSNFGYMFNLGQSNVLKNIRMLMLLVKSILPLPSKLYERSTRLTILGGGGGIVHHV